MIEYTNNVERKKKRKKRKTKMNYIKGKETRGALVGARPRTSSNPKVHISCIQYILTKGTRMYVIVFQGKKTHALHTAHAPVTPCTRAQTGIIIYLKPVPAQRRQVASHAVPKRYMNTYNV